MENTANRQRNPESFFVGFVIRRGFVDFGIGNFPQTGFRLIGNEPIQRFPDIRVGVQYADERNRIQCRRQVIPPERVFKTYPIVRMFVGIVIVRLEEMGFEQLCGF